MNKYAYEVTFTVEAEDAGEASEKLLRFLRLYEQEVLPDVVWKVETPLE